MWKKGLILGLMVMFVLAVAVAPVFAQDAAEAAPKDEGEGQSFLGLVISSAGVIGILIILLSVVTVALLFRAIFTLRQDDLMPPEAQQQLDALLREKRIKEAMDYCRSDDSILSKVIGAGLSEIRSVYDDMKAIMCEVGEEEAIKLHQSIGYFSLIANVSPMLGLFGTVYGMMLTFKTIAESGGMAKPSEMAYGIMTALVTTFLGLLVAIPNVVCFTLFRNKVVRILLEVGVVAEELMGRFKTMQIQGGGAPAPAAGGPQLPSQARAAAAPAAPARPAGPAPGGPAPPAAPAS
jgi:biopolymer transport protein ExbB